jgi:hypothetical protein
MDLSGPGIDDKLKERRKKVTTHSPNKGQKLANLCIFFEKKMNVCQKSESM